MKKNCWTIAAIAAFAINDCAASCLPYVAAGRIFGSGFDLYTLTINNYIAWCSVSVNSGPPSNAPTITNTFADYTPVLLHGGPANGTFVWGYWDGTDGGDHNTSQDTIVTMCADHSVLACCPFASSPDTPCL